MKYAELHRKGHGRQEQYRIWSSSALNDYAVWPRLGQVAIVERIVRTSIGKQSVQVRYLITSLTQSAASAKRLLSLSIGHWSIENRLHWARDDTLREDRSTLSKGHAPRMLAAINNTVLGLLHQAGIWKIAETLRTLAKYPQRAMALLGITVLL